MAGRILVADRVATTRILLKVILTAAHYDVLLAADARAAERLARRHRPSLVVLSDTLGEPCDFSLLARLRSDAPTKSTPIILLSDQTASEWRIAALNAGADEILRRPIREAPLLARIRSLIRASETEAALAQREGAVHDLGFAEPPATFAPQGRIALVTGDRERGEEWRHALSPHLRQRPVVLPINTTILAAQTDAPADVYLIEADGLHPEAGLRLLSELRSRKQTRHASVVIVHREDDPETGVTALDLGANDLVDGDFNACELALRLKIQLERKQRADHLRASVEESLRLAVLDPLTGLFNRRYFDAHAGRIVDRSNETGRGCALLMIDVDRFKAINDSYGHPTGDRVLGEISEILRQNMRAVDIVARMGGEEFAVMMPETAPEAADAAAERLCKAVAETPIAAPGLPMPIRATVSIGVAAWRPGETLPAVTERADAALYRAKAAGRNTVTTAASQAA